jgi:hypothetical protein
MSTPNQIGIYYFTAICILLILSIVLLSLIFFPIPTILIISIYVFCKLVYNFYLK